MIQDIEETLSAFGYLAVTTVMLYVLVVTAPVYVLFKSLASVLGGKEQTEEKPETVRSTVAD